MAPEPPGEGDALAPAWETLAVQHGPAALALLDAQGRVAAANLAFARAVGIERPVGASLDQVVADPPAAALRHDLTFEARLARSGGWVQVDLSAAPARPEAPGWLCQVRDVTERRLLRARLEEVEARLAKLHESPFEGVVLHEGGTILQANGAFGRMVDSPPETLAGLPLADLFPLEERGRIGPVLSRAEGPPERTGLGGPRGEVVPVQVVSREVPFEGRTVVATLVRDVSDVQKAERELVRLRHQHDLVTSSIGEGILGIDQAGRITFVNLAGGRLLGYEPDELTGASHHGLLHHSRPDGTPYPEARCPVTATLRDGGVHHASGEVFWHKDGSPVPVEYTSAPVREQGHLVGAAVIFSDVGERGKAEEAARRAKQEILGIYESIPEAFFSLDREWRLVYMNPLAERMRTTPKEAVMGKVLWAAFPDLVGSRFEQEFKRAVAENRPVALEEHYPRMDRWFEVNAYPTRDGLSVYFRDVTERKRTETELRAASIARPLVRKIVHDLVEAGGVAHQILTQVGRKFADESPAATLDEFLSAYHDDGLGKLELEKAESGRFSFTGQDLLEKQSGSRVPTCSFTLGYLSAAASRVSHGEPTLGTEIECQSRGAKACRFIVQVKKPEEGLARRVKELI